jgi:hypothetical protein
MNAAINIQHEGMRIYNVTIGQRLSEFTLVDNPTMDDPTGNSLLKSSGWMKQEEKAKIYNFS